MNNIDFQNGFALGLASGGVVEVEIPAKEEQEKTITITENGTTEILPDTDKALSKVTVVTNVSSGGGTSLNIAYGETAPEDTSKLWVKANEPANVSVGSDIEGIGSIRTSGTQLPTGCSGMGCARVGNKIYLFGGSNGNSALNTINVFDTETETISTLSTKLPNACFNMGCARVGNKIYLLGGRFSYYTDTNTINVFDTETETITTLSTTLPLSYGSMGCASAGNKIYLFGGNTGGSRLNTINVFDTETETISTLLTKLPTDCDRMGCVGVDNKIYLFGGYGGSYLNTINVFDIATETVTTLSTTLPDQNSNMGCARVGTKIYLFGGYGGSYLNTINVFDIATETVTTLSTTLPTSRISMGCASAGNKIYLFGGSNGNSALNTINCFTLTHELAQGNIELQSGLLNNKFNLINTDTAQIEIGVENVYIGNSNNEAETANAFLFVDGEWKQISYGRDQFAPEEPTGTYSERMYNHYGIDKTEYPYLLIRTHSTNSRIEFFKERILENSSYFFRGYRYADVNVAEGADIATIVASHEASDSSKLSVDTGITTSSSEIADFTYYANFNYAELGYSGVGTWITIE